MTFRALELLEESGQRAEVYAPLVNRPGEAQIDFFEVVVEVGVYTAPTWLLAASQLEVDSMARNVCNIVLEGLRFCFCSFCPIMFDDTDFSAKPPPAIASERVLSYALLDDRIGFNAGHGLMFIDGMELGKVPRLAICEAKKSSKAPLFYCDDDWRFLGVSVHDSVPAAKKRAERLYPGSSSKWVEANFMQEEALYTSIRPPLVAASAAKRQMRTSTRH